MYYVLHNSLFFLSLYLILYVAWYTLHYLTQLPLIFGFLNPENSVLFESIIMSKEECIINTLLY